MLHVSFAMTAEAYADRTKIETRRFWKPSHAAKFKPGTVFMGLDKDFRAGGKKLHPAVVEFCRRERLGDMSQRSFIREGWTRYWRDREDYIQCMGGPDLVPFVLGFRHIDDYTCFACHRCCPKCGIKAPPPFPHAGLCVICPCGWETDDLYDTPREDDTGSTQLTMLDKNGWKMREARMRPKYPAFDKNSEVQW